MDYMGFHIFLPELLFLNNMNLYYKKGLRKCKFGTIDQGAMRHSGCLDPQKILSTIDPPPGVPGVSKNHIFFFTNESVFLLR